MFKLTVDHSGLMRREREAMDRSMESFVSDLGMRVPRLTGTYADSLRASTSTDAEGNLISTISSPLARGLALEWGAHVGPRPGPHMTGSHAIRDALPVWAQEFSREMSR